jgi:hypothetical protein
VTSLDNLNPLTTHWVSHPSTSDDLSPLLMGGPWVGGIGCMIPEGRCTVGAGHRCCVLKDRGGGGEAQAARASVCCLGSGREQAVSRWTMCTYSPPPGLSMGTPILLSQPYTVSVPVRSSRHQTPGCSRSSWTPRSTHKSRRGPRLHRARSLPRSTLSLDSQPAVLLGHWLR